MKKSDLEGKKNSFNKYLRFSSIAIQMGVIIGAGALLGDWLDKTQENTFPIWTLVLVLLAIFGALYQVIREVIKLGKEDDVQDQSKK